MSLGKNVAGEGTSHFAVECGWEGGEKGEEDRKVFCTDRTVKEEPHSRKTIHSQLPPSATPPPTLAASPPFSHRRITKTWNSASKILPTKSHPSMNYFLKICSVLALYWCCGDITGESAFPVWALLLDSCQEKHLGLQWLLFNLWLSGYFFTW